MSSDGKNLRDNLSDYLVSNLSQNSYEGEILMDIALVLVAINTLQMFAFAGVIVYFYRLSMRQADRAMSHVASAHGTMLAAETTAAKFDEPDMRDLPPMNPEQLKDDYESKKAALLRDYPDLAGAVSAGEHSLGINDDVGAPLSEGMRGY